MWQRRRSGRRPDIIGHERGSHANNLLAIEIKRNKRDLGRGLGKITKYWFADPLRYQFGAVVVMSEKEDPFVVVIRNRRRQLWRAKGVTAQGAEAVVVVRRERSTWRTASYRLRDIGSTHWDFASCGVRVPAPPPFLHGYVSCDGMLDGEVAHSAAHGRCPHRIKVTQPHAFRGSASALPAWPTPTSLWQIAFSLWRLPAIGVFRRPPHAPGTYASSAPRSRKSVPSWCPTGMKTDALGATRRQAKVRVVARLAHPWDVPADYRS